MIIIKRNKYGNYLNKDVPFLLESDEYYKILMEEAMPLDDYGMPTIHTGGFEELKGEVMKLKDKAFSATKTTVRVILSKLKMMLVWVKDRFIAAKPEIKKYADKISNFIMNAIEDIKDQLA